MALSLLEDLGGNKLYEIPIALGNVMTFLSTFSCFVFFFKLLVKWSHWKGFYIGLSRQDCELKNLCIVLKIEE